MHHFEANLTSEFRNQPTPADIPNNKSSMIRFGKFWTRTPLRVHYKFLKPKANPGYALLLRATWRNVERIQTDIICHFITNKVLTPNLMRSLVGVCGIVYLITSYKSHHCGNIMCMSDLGKSCCTPPDTTGIS